MKNFTKHKSLICSIFLFVENITKSQKHELNKGRNLFNFIKLIQNIKQKKNKLLIPAISSHFWFLWSLHLLRIEQNDLIWYLKKGCLNFLCFSMAIGKAEHCWALVSKAVWRTGVLMMKRIARRSSARSCSHRAARQMCRPSLSCCRSSWRPSTKK